MACSSKRYEDAKNENQQFSIDDIGQNLSSYNINVFKKSSKTITKPLNKEKKRHN